MNNRKEINDRVVDWIISKVKTEYADDISVVLIYSLLNSFTSSITSSSEVMPAFSASPCISACNICIAYTAELTIRTELFSFYQS